MSTNDKSLLTGIIISDSQKVTFDDLCNCCSISAEQIKVMIEHGIISPLQFKSDVEHWYFTGKCILRVKTVIRLQRDLGVNMAGAALALELLEEIKNLRRIKDMNE